MSVHRVDLRASNAVELSQLTVPQIEHSVQCLQSGIAKDDLLHWLMISATLLERAKGIRQRVEATAIEWINRNGSFECGPVLYTVGQQKQVKCVDVLVCMQLVLEACGGDIDAACAYFASNPFKYGACSKLLAPSAWQRVFEESRQEKLVLKALDKRFLPHEV